MVDHWHDILVGSLLGLVMSYFAYRQYYPSLASVFSHHPYSPRIPDETVGADEVGPTLPITETNGYMPTGIRDSQDESHPMETFSESEARAPDSSTKGDQFV